MRIFECSLIVIFIHIYTYTINFEFEFFFWRLLSLCECLSFALFSCHSHTFVTNRINSHITTTLAFANVRMYEFLYHSQRHSKINSGIRKNSQKFAAIRIDIKAPRILFSLLKFEIIFKIPKN